MTLRQAMREAESSLLAAQNSDARFDALCLAQKAFGLDAVRLRTRQSHACTPEELAVYRELTRRRAAGEPLQYILGEWEFYSLPFAVGPGVLIPRPETELLVDAALQFLESKSNAIVYDLCAGSGCAGLSVIYSSHCIVDLYLAEIMPEALLYLRRNTERYSRFFYMHVVEWDVLAPPPGNAPSPDLILANPPYIPSAELSSLATEVQQEPSTALDGGEDGLLFYRAIARHWLPKLNPGGMLAMECGDGQAGDISKLLPSGHAEIIKDIAGIERVVLYYAGTPAASF